MATFRIVHQTQYRYSDRVALEPHYFRLLPRPDGNTLVSRSLQIVPEPSGTSQVVDVDGNQAVFAWFDGLTDRLDVRTGLVVRTVPRNPFDFLVYPVSCARLPMIYPPGFAAALAPFLSREETPELGSFALGLAAAAGHDTVQFLMGVCRAIGEGFRYERRDQGPPQDTATTLREKKGCCRDFAVLAMAVCRRMGLASRYASGYFLNEDAAGQADLHAWMEVFLPGAGWKGFDPAQGLACDQRHLVLSTSMDPCCSMPVTGTFRGDASCRMTVDLVVDRVAEPS